MSWSFRRMEKQWQTWGGSGSPQMLLPCNKGAVKTDPTMRASYNFFHNLAPSNKHFHLKEPNIYESQSHRRSSRYIPLLYSIVDPRSHPWPKSMVVVDTVDRDISILSMIAGQMIVLLTFFIIGFRANHKRGCTHFGKRFKFLLRCCVFIWRARSRYLTPTRLRFSSPKTLSC